ncbi:hypothetical protein PSH28_07385 [Pseudomonas resinovorans]|uniref:hypothetical protein n=1 Tax=Metapseudomonas resinovorans TaxID=53412 RepID=UPI00237F8C8F|nr:hypothetical protein [Pseudomonas resinovorans]MDE3736409.1 hypothetical protein [Pseudomonas resinovorans]
MDARSFYGEMLMGRSGKVVYKKNRSTTERDQQAAKYKASIRYSQNPKVEIFRIKNFLSPQELFSVFPFVFSDAKYLDRVHGSPFPREVSEVFAEPALFRPVSIVNEIIWSICRCLKYSADLRRFVELAQSLECGILADEKSACERVLDEIGVEFGLSTWLLQAKLSVAQSWDGFEGAAQIQSIYEQEINKNYLLYVVFWFAKKRIEATSVKDYIESELQRVTADYDNESLQKYLHCKILNQNDMQLESAAPLLFHEAQSSIIDHYEALVSVLQSLVSRESFSPDLWEQLEKPILSLYGKISDPRLKGIVRYLGVEPAAEGESIERALAIEAYSAGKYLECIRLSDSVLVNQPNDMHVFTLKVKAMQKSGLTDSRAKGVARDLEHNLLDVLRFNEESYTAAHSLLTLANRFYGMAWINYIKSFVMYKLDSERHLNPGYWFRELLLRDGYLSPYTLLIYPSGSPVAIEAAVDLADNFPSTFKLFNVFAVGELTGDAPVDEVLARKQLARYLLSENRLEESLECYQWLCDSVNECERVKYFGAVALVHMLSGNVIRACEAVVTAYMENGNVPSVLPIKELMKDLSDPSVWEDSIAIPLILSIYLEYYGGDRLADLRYAFEKFQLENGIESPDDLLRTQAGLGVDVLVAYMDRVWRPEIMRQTLLYDGSREIEEARIKVCQKLVEIDSSNAKKYLEEIKERVKQLEIAKAMTLVEKSKVYVDIDAIKKALKVKLADTYARYKALSPVVPTERDDIIEAVSKVFQESVKDPDTSLSNFLSGLHLLDGSMASESDAQFESLFSEVTNEFLKGAHGLNAYLSTRVRHGTLSNTLRKAVEDEKLVTTKEEGGDTYSPNDYWVDDSQVENQSDFNARINVALNAFSEDFDKILDYIKDQLLQIRIAHKISDGSDGSKALFVYRSSNLERRLAQIEDRNLKDIDQFIDRCVDTLWEKTDRNLEAVQHALRNEIKDRIQLSFDTLTERLNELPWTSVIGNILNAVGRARTNTRVRLETVASWFKRSEVYDRQDFNVDFPIHIAVNMIKNTMSIASDWQGVVIDIAQGSRLVPGRALDAMVYIFYGLIENAINHSKLPVSDIFVNAAISYLDGKYKVRFSNRVNLSRRIQEDVDRLGQIRNSILLKESTKRAQGEGKSGLHKIWLMASGPFHKDAVLEFDWNDDEFVVDLAFSLEWS